MKNKFIASLMAAIMAMATFTMPVLAAVNLGGFPGFLGLTSAGVTSLDAYFVVGSGANPLDVVSAIDIAVTAASVSSQDVTTTGAVAVTGLDRDGINIGRASGGALLSSGGVSYSNAFPSAALVKTAHFSGLKDSTFSYKSNDYDYREQIDVGSGTSGGGVKARHDFGTSNINGTEKLEFGDSDIVYEYVFEKDLNITSILSSTTGTISNPEYTNPVKIKLLGKDFTIVGVGSTSIKALTGSSGTADATTPVTHESYSVYCTQGSNGSWAKLVVKDATGNTVATEIINQNDSKDLSAIGLTIKVTSVKALQDGTCVGADVVIGPTGTVEKEYDTSADVTSTGTASDRFPGETKWGIQIAGSGWGPGKIPANGKIQVVYKPSQTEYLKAGEKLVFPNNYAELGHVGFGTDKFATITIRPVTGMTAYNNNSDTSQVASSLNGLEISSDTASSIIANGGNTYSKAYFLLAAMPNASHGRVIVGFWDNAKSKLMTSGNVTNSTGGGIFNISDEFADLTFNNSAFYSFKLSYSGAGEKDWYLNITLNASNSTDLFTDIQAGWASSSAGAQDWNTIIYQNKTVWSTSQAPEFRLGATATTSETSELKAYTEGTLYGIGKSSQDVVSDSGLIFVSPEANSGSEQVKFKVPSKDLTVHAYVGTSGAAATTAGVVKKVVPVTNAVAKLDTEITATEKAKNIVSVGGACINKITAEAMNLTFPACGSASGVPENAALIKVFDGVFTPGKVVLVVAGWEAGNTRTAASVLQQYGTLLAGSTATAVKVTAANAAGITPM